MIVGNIIMISNLCTCSNCNQSVQQQQRQRQSSDTVVLAEYMLPNRDLHKLIHPSRSLTHSCEGLPPHSAVGSKCTRASLAHTQRHTANVRII